MPDVWRTIGEIRGAMESVRDHLDPALVEAANADLDRVVARFRLTGTHTVAALVGGTGSGKSSLFNLLTHSTFADVGEVRPSTHRASACTWVTRADALLDHLGVAQERRIVADSGPDPSQLAALEGLVLLDMPDHDSVVLENSAQVDRLLPLVDVLIWVVDPQKYADHILHENYLRPLSSRADAMVVVLNQTDTVMPQGLDAVDADVRRLLAADGLGAVEVVRTCAATGEGVEQLREILRGAVAEQSTATRTAQAEVRAVACRLLAGMGEDDARVGDAAVALTADDLLRANGIGAVAASIRAAVRQGRGEVASPQPPSRATVTAIGSSWAARARRGLPPRWCTAVDDVLPPVEELMGRTTAAVQSVALPDIAVGRASALRFATAAVLVLGVAGLVAGVALDWPPWAAAGAALLGAAAAWLLSRGSAAARAAAAEERATQYENAVRSALTHAVAATLAAPTRQVLEQHRAVRAAFETVA